MWGENRDHVECVVAQLQKQAAFAHPCEGHELVKTIIRAMSANNFGPLQNRSDGTLIDDSRLPHEHECNVADRCSRNTGDIHICGSR
jgi:hypothetical protein